MKLKVEDLRVGNLVYSGINSNEIIKVYPMFLVQFFKIQEEEHNIKPIPLNKSIAISLGFKPRRADDWLVQYIENHVFYYNHIDDILQIESVSDLHGGVCYISIEDNYVHTLQNLVKALTNTELTCN